MSPYQIRARIFFFTFLLVLKNYLPSGSPEYFSFYVGIYFSTYSIINLPSMMKASCFRSSGQTIYRGDCVTSASSKMIDIN